MAGKIIQPSFPVPAGTEATGGCADIPFVPDGTGEGVSEPGTQP